MSSTDTITINRREQAQRSAQRMTPTADRSRRAIRAEVRPYDAMYRQSGGHLAYVSRRVA